MSRMQSASERRTLIQQSLFCTVFAAGVALSNGTAIAQASNTLPDAQVESNVLKALASAPELANESVRTTTVYGTVTLSGSVANEELRTKAENLAANANGVKKVVDELTLGTSSATTIGDPNTQPVDSGSGSNMVLQSDGTMVPANPTGQPNQAQAQPQAMPTQNGGPQNPQPAPPPQYANGGRQPMTQPYNAPPPGYYAQQPPPYGGQQPGVTVVVPVGTMLRVRVNQRLTSNRTQPGTPFDGVVVNDVVAGGEVAIPRGASVRGTVIDAKSSGALAGRGELAIQLTQIMLGGKTYNITSDVWAHNGADKTVETVNKTAGFGAIGALLGAAAGGGAGAAIGGGIGAAAGLGSSASSGRGQVIVPSEGIVSFTLNQQVAVVTVSEQEMQRLAYGVPYGAQPNYPPPPRRYYGPTSYGPVYYPGYAYPYYAPIPH